MRLSACLPIAALLVTLFLGSACSFTKNLDAHRASLLAATGPDVSLSEKRDALGTSAVSMMSQAVDKLNPKRGVKYVEAYAKTNGPLLDTLVAQITRGQEEMDRGERVKFLLGAASRPYVREAVGLIPRFIAKYKQIQAVSRITGGLKEAVLGKAADTLGGLLGENEGGGGASLRDLDRCAPLGDLDRCALLAAGPSTASL